jgi:hypothetical protein
MNLVDDPEIRAHLTRLETALFNSYDLGDVVRYLEDKTYLKGNRFSFVDHEFQKDILSDTSRVVYVQKCAQIGMSEAMARYALAICRVMPYFSVILTMPFAADSANFSKTRLTPIIDESPDLREVVDRDLDNSEIKGIGTSLLYTRGCSGTTSAISVPADMLIHDEVDRSDPDALGQYQSRIKHSRYKLTRKFGTPTIDDNGIALDMKSAMRYRRAVICHHCSHTFVPSFHTDVKIPGYSGRLRDITKYNLPTIDWQHARLHCPHCDEEPSLAPEHRSWICENPNDNFEAIGYYVTPFDVPNVVTVPSLVQEITKYKSWAEFVNQALGETANESESQLTRSDLTACKFTDGVLASNSLHNMGIDVGQMCTVAVGRKDELGRLLVVHKERVLLAQLPARRLVLKKQFRVLMTVIDSQPETYLVHQLQKSDKNLYGGVYHSNKKLATYELVMVGAEPAEGKLPINQAKIHRDVNFDEVMFKIKGGMVLWQGDGTPEDDLFIEHCLDMKRKQIMNSLMDLVWTWVKSNEGQDHYMHALGYLHVACELAPVASHNMSFGTFPMAVALKVVDKQSPTQALAARMQQRIGRVLS